jgi:hypothetical protein
MLRIVFGLASTSRSVMAAAAHMALRATHAVSAKIDAPVTPAPTAQPPASMPPKPMQAAPVR